MIHTVKKYVIPHEGNSYKPHLLREKSIGVLFCLGFLLFCTSFGSSYLLHKTDFGALVLPAVLVDLTNEHRVENNQKPLSINPLLEEAAHLKAKDMAGNDYFAHTSPTGVTPWQWFANVGYRYAYAGENLAINFTESTDVESAWIASPTHHANLINEKFDETGIATYDGMYNGHPTTFVVQLFGRRAVNRVIPPIPVVAGASITSSPSKKSTTPTSSAVVKGAGTIKLTQAPISPKEPSPVLLVNEPTFAVAYNANESGEVHPQPTMPVSKYSTVIERVLVHQARYVQYTYLGLILLIYAVLVLMIIVEFRTQHIKNIALGILFLCFLGALAYINSGFILSIV